MTYVECAPAAVNDLPLEFGVSPVSQESIDHEQYDRILKATDMSQVASNAWSPMFVFKENGLMVEQDDGYGDISVNRIHFLPNNRTNHSYANLSQTILGGLVALEDFVTAVDIGVIPRPALIEGQTNKEMARFAVHAGFQDMHQVKGEHFIMATCDSIKAAISSFDPVLKAKLQRRADRPAPSSTS